MGGKVAGSNIFRQTAGRVLLAFAIAAALIAVYTVVDASRRGFEEGYDFPTALADNELFPADSVPFEPTRVEFSVDGQAFYRQKAASMKRYDKYMFKSGREDGDRFYVYRYLNPRYGTGSPEGVFYAKIGEREYFEFGTSPAETQSAAPKVPSE
jgi:hypothetical protein